MEQLLDELYIFERDNDLLNYEIDNIKIWQYLRATIFSEILTQKGFIGNKSKYIKETNKKLKVKDRIKFLLNSIVLNPFFSFKVFRGVDDIFLLSSRKYYFNDSLEDIYLYDIYSKSDNKLMIDSGGYSNLFYKRAEWIFLPKVLLQKTIYKTTLDINTIQYLDKLEYDLSLILGFSLSLKGMFTKYLSVYKSLYTLNNILFKVYKPKRVYLISGYGQAPMIKVAKDLGVETIEVQHGIFGQMHYGYYFPFNQRLDYFPDKLLVFGEYFQKLDYLPLDIKNRKIHIYSFFNNKKNNYLNLIQKNNLLIVSDGFDSGIKYIDFLVNNMDILNSYDKVYYKLHPQEEDEFYKDIAQIQKLMRLKNFEFVHVNEHIYKYLASCKYVISCRSTVIYEALEFGCNVGVVKLDGYKDMLDLEKNVTFLDLKYKIRFEKKRAIDKGYFFKCLQK